MSENKGKPEPPTPPFSDYVIGVCREYNEKITVSFSKANSGTSASYTISIIEAEQLSAMLARAALQKASGK